MIAFFGKSAFNRLLANALKRVAVLTAVEVQSVHEVDSKKRLTGRFLGKGDDRQAVRALPVIVSAGLRRGTKARTNAVLQTTSADAPGRDGRPDTFSKD